MLYVAWNRLEYTRESFEALLVNTDWSAVGKLYVHDDGSTDGTAKWLAENIDRCPSAHVWDGIRRGGPVAAMNWYLDVSDPGVARFAKVDNDFIVCPGWLGALQQVLDDYPKLDIVGTEPWFGDPQPADMERDYRTARHIGGKGVMRRNAFKRWRPKPGGWNGYQGFTQWQTAHSEITKGWVFPDLACFGLDQVAADDGPWRHLAEVYAEREWQRLWSVYESDEHYSWWKPVYEVDA